MQARLFARETGDLHPRQFAQTIAADLLRSFAPAPQHRFNSETLTATAREGVPPRPEEEERAHGILAHGAGVSGLALEKFDGRILLSGGAEGSIKFWDLDACANPHKSHTFRPVSTIARSTAGTEGGGHRYGITHLAFYPFDPDAFLSSSYDHSLKLWATQRAALSVEFDLGTIIYSHSTSPVADHLLVACATQHASVRLVDLKSGSAVQALLTHGGAHGGPVLCTAWSPRHEHILASGHTDGKVRVWDIRRAGGVVAQLDQEDSLGVVHKLRHRDRVHYRASARAHDEAVNGLQWTDDGRYIVTACLDPRIRVWDADTGANTLASFGRVIQNNHVNTASFLVTPSGLSTGQRLLIWPNDQEILILNLDDGNVVARLKSPGAANHPLGPRGSQMERGRITNIVWRSAGGGGGQIGPAMGGGTSVGAIYSAHMDGRIRAWMPQLPGPDDVDENEELNEDEEVRTRKRKAVDDAYRSLMGKKITFT